MRGGVYKRNEGKSEYETLLEFMDQCDCKILTDNSVSCITYLFSRKTEYEGQDSPYVAFRYNNLGENINSILLKVFLGLDKNVDIDLSIKHANCIKKQRSAENSDKVECINFEDLKKEAEIQDYTYKKSYIASISALDPICPAIITYSDKLLESGSDKENEFKEKILQNLKNRIRKNGTEINDTVITENWFSNTNEVKYKDIPSDIPSDISEETLQKGTFFIAMEMMNGYSSLYDVLDNLFDLIKFKNNEEYNKKYKEIFYMCLWQFIVLSYFIGIKHNDAHGDNIMFNLEKTYFYTMKGQPLIIDFGKAEYNDLYRNPKQFQNTIFPNDKSIIYDILLGHDKFIINWLGLIMWLNNMKNSKEDFDKHIKELKEQNKLAELKQLFIDNLDINLLNTLSSNRNIISNKAIYEFKDINGDKSLLGYTLNLDKNIYSKREDKLFYETNLFYTRIKEAFAYSQKKFLEFLANKSNNSSGPEAKRIRISGGYRYTKKKSRKTRKTRNLRKSRQSKKNSKSRNLIKKI